ncbi:MAG: 50S ribosomal protein L21 [Caldilineaceae bacterium]
MYAVVKTGGKQYRVTAGQILEVEKLDGNVGDVVTLDDVLLVADGDDVTIGQPAVDGASVLAKITGQHRGKKILSFRYRPKKRIRVRRGHRQYLTRLQIESVSFGGKTYDAAAAKAAAPKSKPQNVVETAVESATDLGVGATAAVSEMVESAAETVAETASNAVDAVANVAESVSDTVVDAGETVVDVIHSAGDAAMGAVADVVDAADAADGASDEENV